jgi:hypothetical protein
VSTGLESTVVSGAALAMNAGYVFPAWADDAWLYYADFSGLERVPMGGGAIQTVWSAGESVVEAVVGNGCAIFWTTYDPSGVPTLMTISE